MNATITAELNDLHLRDLRREAAQRRLVRSARRARTGGPQARRSLRHPLGGSVAAAR